MPLVCQRQGIAAIKGLSVPSSKSAIEMQIFYDKIQGLTVEPTDSIQHVKDLIEVCLSVHTLLKKSSCNLRLSKLTPILSGQQDAGPTVSL